MAEVTASSVVTVTLNEDEAGVLADILGDTDADVVDKLGNLFASLGALGY